MDIITNVLYWLTTGLLVPVIVLLLLLFVRSLLLGGAFYGVYINRQKSKKQLDKAMNGKSVTEFLSELQIEKNSSKFWEFLEKMKENTQSDAYIEKVIGDYEIVADKDLGQSKSLTKLGPMLGLMGTLIPMGPALVGLSTGDVSTMAHNMQVAFATTVVGVFIGAIGFITLQVKQRWYADDM
ncbi:MAG: MotA/TolQ/ExbB proton channel family protein, partial [Flavobacteriaceae bacterium]|nr:MotA/TolQ/ExbB proton channel family protein [Flavobacteriaceae bacterium]